jgi:hypothetical protein
MSNKKQMSDKKQFIPTGIKILATLLIPLIITAVSVYYYATDFYEANLIYPHVTIAGVDMSGMTRDEAIQSLYLEQYEESIANANVTFTFPDDSVLFIEATDVDMQHNAEELVFLAHTVGRGRYPVLDWITYLHRQEEEAITYDISFWLDRDELNRIVNEFISNYNDKLDAAKPVIYEDRIVLTIGAGLVNVDAAKVFELAYNGLFESFKSGEPVEYTYTLPEVTTTRCEILGLRNKIFVQTVTSVYDIESKSATECVTGVDFNPIKAVWLVNDTEPGKTATIPLVFTQPEYSQEYLQSLLFRDLIGTRTTYVRGSVDRLNNVRISGAAINGVILLPGEEFSFNGVVGRRTFDRGYRSAPMIVEGVFVPAIGGGVCQTSSTLFAAIKPSELLVTEQRPHSRSIPYLPRGWDAAVAWDKLDFKFVNNTEYPIRINADLTRRDLTMQIWGTIIDDFPIAANWQDLLEEE